MSFTDVIVTITRETKALSQAGFGLPLILATSKAHPYTLYADISEVSPDFAETTKEYKLATAIFAQNPKPEQVAIHGIVYVAATGEPTTLTAALNALVESHNDWYYLTCVEQGDDEITALAGWVNTQKKLYGASTSNKALVATLSSERTFIIYHDQPEKYPAEAWIGYCAPLEIGSYTWKFKTLNGIPAAIITTTDFNQLHDNHGNTYVEKFGVLQTSEGTVSTGEYIDIIQSQDWLEARITEAVERLLMTKPKVPYDNSGIAMVVAEITNVLKQGYRQDMIATDADGLPMYSVDAPNREDIPVNDRASRVLTGIEFTAVLAGAVHNVRIKGTLTI